MGQVVLEQRQGTNEISNWTELFMNRNKGRGKIAVGTLIKPDDFEFMDHQFYANNQVNWLKKNHIGKVNTFISTNAFDSIAGEIRRKSEFVVQVRVIGIDLDCYKDNIDPLTAEATLKQMVKAGEIPEPNLVVRSGNGLQFFYGIDGGVPAQLSWLTTHIAMAFVLKTTHLGSDPQCVGLERVFRMPFTVNDKPGRGRKPTSSNIWRKTEYDLSELYAYCEPIKHRAPQGPRNRPKLSGLPKSTEMGHKTLSLNRTRIADFYKLIELRNGNIENRHLMTYDFAFILSLMHEDEKAVLLQAQRFNTNFDDPQPIQEVERTASSAFEDGRRFWNAFQANGHSLKGLTGTNDGLIKPKRNDTIIRQQAITLEEMEHLDTLISGEVSYARKVAKRRAQGVKERSQYEEERQQQKADRIDELRKLRAERPAATHKELATEMSVSTKTVQRWLKEL